MLAIFQRRGAAIEPRSATRTRLWALLAVAFSLAGCATLAQPTNAPLATDSSGTPKPQVDYSILGVRQADENSRELMVLVAISGGGKRSSAFSYGVLRALRDIKLAPDQSLLSQVDAIAGVSGGSFTAAYYALHRDATFLPQSSGCGFEHDFLFVDYKAELYNVYLEPWNWGWMFSDSYGTNDHMANLYAERMFAPLPAGATSGCGQARADRPFGATYADLFSLGSPVLLVGTTDIAQGYHFAFSQAYFNLLCSDMSNYPVAWAVAASNGFPGLLSSVTLKNYRFAGIACPGKPAWMEAAQADHHTFEETLNPADYLTELAAQYTDTDLQAKYAHLNDGGITDNLALRGLTDWAVTHSELESDTDPLKYTKRILLISVDGESTHDPSIASDARGPGLLPAAEAVLDTTVDHYNAETLMTANDVLGTMAEKIQAHLINRYGQKDAAKPQVYFAHITIKNDPNMARQNAVKQLPTSLGLTEDQVRQLIDSGYAAALCGPEADPDEHRRHPNELHKGLADFVADIASVHLACPEPKTSK